MTKILFMGLIFVVGFIAFLVLCMKKNQDKRKHTGSDGPSGGCSGFSSSDGGGCGGDGGGCGGGD